MYKSGQLWIGFSIGFNEHFCTHYISSDDEQIFDFADDQEDKSRLVEDESEYSDQDDELNENNEGTECDSDNSECDEAVLLILKYYLKHNLTMRALEDLLRLFNELFSMKTESVPKSKYPFKKAIPKMEEPIIHYYCKVNLCVTISNVKTASTNSILVANANQHTLYN